MHTIEGNIGGPDMTQLYPALLQLFKAPASNPVSPMPWAGPKSGPVVARASGRETVAEQGADPWANDPILKKSVEDYD